MSAFARRRTAVAAAGFLGVLVVAAVLAPVLAPHDPARTYDLVLQQNLPPSRAYPLGTDPSARDVLSRVLYGARVSLGVAALGAAVALAIGTAWGATAGALGGRIERWLMRVVDVLLGVPRILVLLAVVALWGAVGAPALGVLLGLTTWPSTGRIVRARVAAVRRAEFVAAARALGASPARVLLRHLPPHAAGVVAVSGTLLFGDLLALEAGLSFIGLGVRPPDPSWGSMVQDGAPYLLSAPWTSLVPTACIAGTVLAASVLGDALADRARPRRRG